jgi:hypothetical protein
VDAVRSGAVPVESAEALLTRSKAEQAEILPAALNDSTPTAKPFSPTMD